MSCSFENCETRLINLKKLVLQTLFLWRVAVLSVLILIFSISALFNFLFELGVSCVYPVYHGLRSSALCEIYFIYQ
jgi:hypothetical protein